MKRQNQVVTALGSTSLVFLLPPTAHAACSDISGGVSGGSQCSAQGTSIQGKTLGSNIHNITNILLYVVGFAAVVMIIIGGLRYIFSGGDPGNTRSAKDTILFAVVGLVIALLAFAIVNFVFSRF